MRASLSICLIPVCSLIAQTTPPATQAPQWSPERAFATWDQNADAKLTADEVPRPELFKMLDTDGDGVVAREEAASVRRGGASAGVGQGMGQAARWKDTGVSEGAPLPPAEDSKPRPHGDEAVKAGLKPDVLGRLDVELQRHVAASNVAGIVALIHKNGQRGYFETFGMADIEAGKPMPKDGIFRLMSMTKPVIAVAALTLYDEGKFSPDEPISKHCPEWASPKVLEDGKPLDVVLKKKVFVPLKMVDTDFWVPPAKASRICQIYTQPQPGVLKPGREASKLTEKPSLFLGGHGLCSTTTDQERFCRMILNRGELDGVRVLKPETVDLMFQNHLKPGLSQKYGLGGAVDGEGGYSWGGANGTQFWIDRKNNLFAFFMVQTQHYRAPAYGAFRTLVNEAAGIVSRRGGMTGAGAGGKSGLFKQRDSNRDGKLSREEPPGALFDRLDVNKDGFVTEEEASALLTTRQ